MTLYLMQKKTAVSGLVRWRHSLQMSSAMGYPSSVTFREGDR
ncbi:hypothetical protein [Nostoc sp.]